MSYQLPRVYIDSIKEITIDEILDKFNGVPYTEATWHALEETVRSYYTSQYVRGNIKESEIDFYTSEALNRIGI